MFVAKWADLWRFNTSSLRWAWMAGSSTQTRTQHAFGCFLLIVSVSSCQLRLDRNIGRASGFRCDLTHLLQAPANFPGSRQGSGMVVDNGLVFLFGGQVYESSSSPFQYLNDLWKFDGSVWTWLRGCTITASTTGGSTASYGVLGVQVRLCPLCCSILFPLVMS